MSHFSYWNILGVGYVEMRTGRFAIKMVSICAEKGMNSIYIPSCVHVSEDTLANIVEPGVIYLYDSASMIIIY